ncbi:MAG TPA: glycine/sarcosine/betaine reductase selenoprotein B family protein [Rhodospirillales bacterium]|nr:glycine/sarcosine/betaine reductase selenoprotein B family protein [Rhodospirillales bacterium]HJO69642.1 glycine/sarcosine/betaine reductase selenoprotein B family protein [Rhodospirillales bacterium]
MVRLSDVSAGLRVVLERMPCPSFETRPWVSGPPVSERRVALITSAALQRPGDRPFTYRESDYRVIPRNAGRDLLMSHSSTNFDRTGFVEDLNVIFPLDRLEELAADGTIGSVAEYHYSVMGSVEPLPLEATGAAIAELFLGDAVDACVLVPV